MANFEEIVGNLDDVDICRLLKELPPWDDDKSYQFLRLRELLLLSSYTADEEEADINVPYYFFTTPNPRALWPSTTGHPVCPYCGKEELSLHKYPPKPRLVDDIPFHGKRTRLVILFPVYKCKNCGKTFRPNFTFVDRYDKLTKRHIQRIQKASMEKRSFEQVAYDMCVDDETVRNYFEIESARLEREGKFELAEHIGIDEAKVHTKDSSSFYVCLMNTDVKHTERNGIIELLKIKRTEDAITTLFSRFVNPEAVKTISMDMCAAYRAAALTVFPDARIIVDRFHLVQNLNDKLKKTVSELYFSMKKSLECIAKIEIPSECDGFPNEEPYAVLHEKDPDVMFVDEDVYESWDIPTDKGICDDIPETGRIVTRVSEAKEKLSILKDNFHLIWFVMNPESLSSPSRVRLFRLLETFPEFKAVYLVKEIMRYDFFNAATKEDAHAIAEKAEAMLPKGREYHYMRTYFNTLKGEQWGPHIYSYFEDPIEQRYSNAKLENVNRIIKAINAAANGLSWATLKKKIIYGDTSAPHRKRPSALKAKPRVYDFLMAITPLSYDQLDEAILSYPAGVPAPEDWDVVLSFRSVKALGINSKFPSEMPLEEKIDSIIYNNNITIPLQQLLEAMTEGHVKGSSQFGDSGR